MRKIHKNPLIDLSLTAVRMGGVVLLLILFFPAAVVVLVLLNGIK